MYDCQYDMYSRVFFSYVFQPLQKGKKKGQKSNRNKKASKSKSNQRKNSKKTNLPHGGNDLSAKLYATMEKHKEVSLGILILL